MNALSSRYNLPRESRRKEKRNSTLKSAQIIYGGLWGGVVDCYIVDLTSTGARLETAITFDLPEFFLLRFNDATERRVHKRWGSGVQIGVEFADEIQSESLTLNDSPPNLGV